MERKHGGGKKKNLQKHSPEKEKENIPRVTNFKQLVISSNIIILPIFETGE